MLAGASRGDHVLRVNVEDKQWKKRVICTVTVKVVYLNDTIVSSSSSLRLAGMCFNCNKIACFQCIILHIVEAKLGRCGKWRLLLRGTVEDSDDSGG